MYMHWYSMWHSMCVCKYRYIMIYTGVYACIIYIYVNNRRNEPRLLMMLGLCTNDVPQGIWPEDITTETHVAIIPPNPTIINHHSDCRQVFCRFPSSNLEVLCWFQSDPDSIPNCYAMEWGVDSGHVYHGGHQLIHSSFSGLWSHLRDAGHKT